MKKNQRTNRPGPANMMELEPKSISTNVMEPEPKTSTNFVVVNQMPENSRRSSIFEVVVLLGIVSGLIMGVLFLTGYDPSDYFKKKPVVTEVDPAAKAIDEMLESVMRDSDEAAKLYDEAKANGTLEVPSTANAILLLLSRREDTVNKAMSLRFKVKLPISNNDQMLAGMACDLTRTMQETFGNTEEGQALCYKAMLENFPKPK